MDVGGFTGEQAGKPVRIRGTVKYFGEGWGYDEIAMIEFGDNNLLFLVPTYTQIRTLSPLRIEGLNPDDYDVFVVKSRVHFRRGFDETGYAKTIMVVDAPGDWFGTTRLDALDYQHAPINTLYPSLGLQLVLLRLVGQASALGGSRQTDILLVIDRLRRFDCEVSAQTKKNPHALA